jgi:hypothetical protein
MKKVKIDPGVFGKNYYFTEITQEISETCIFLLGLMFCMKDCMHLVDLDYPFQTFVYLNDDIAKYVHYRPSYDDIFIDKAQNLVSEIGIVNPQIESPMTLADIYNYSENFDATIKSKSKGSIGFNKK